MLEWKFGEDPYLVNGYQGKWLSRQMAIKANGYQGIWENHPVFHYVKYRNFT